MTTITSIILRVESMIKKPIVENHTFFSAFTFSKISSFAYHFYRNTAFIISNLQKDFHQDNLSFVCLQFYKHNRQNILADNIFLSYTSKESIEMTVKDSYFISSPSIQKTKVSINFITKCSCFGFYISAIKDW